MKWLFSFFLLANVGYLMWGAWYKETPHVSTALQPRLEFNAETMKLVAEVEGKPKLRRSGKPAVRKLKDVTPPRQCYRVGPFIKKRTAKGVRKWFAKQVLTSSLEKGSATSYTYRLILTGYKTEKGARAARDRLTKKGFKDHSYIKGKKGTYAISVGVFSVKRNANKQRKALKASGFKAKRFTKKHSSRRYWVRAKSEKNLWKTLKRHKWGETQARAKVVKCKKTGK